jgi:hypothetical protein
MGQFQLIIKLWAPVVIYSELVATLHKHIKIGHVRWKIKKYQSQTLHLLITIHTDGPHN